MKIWTYCICRNEKRIMPYFLRHYSDFADKMIFYDDQSDDGTTSLIHNSPKTELRTWPGTHGIADNEFLDFANEQWKEARGKADWIIWVDADEFIYHPNILELLGRYLSEGIILPLVEGWGMVSDSFPEDCFKITDLIKTGFRSPEWDKSVVFQPTFDMRWNVGRHSINLTEPLPKRSATAELKLLHYRYLGMEWVMQRNFRNFKAQPEELRKFHYGDNNWPDATKAYSTKWFEEFRKQKFENVI